MMDSNTQNNGLSEDDMNFEFNLNKVVFLKCKPRKQANNEQISTDHLEANQFLFVNKKAKKNISMMDSNTQNKGLTEDDMHFGFSLNKVGFLKCKPRKQANNEQISTDHLEANQMPFVDNKDKKNGSSRDGGNLSTIIDIEHLDDANGSFQSPTTQVPFKDNKAKKNSFSDEPSDLSVIYEERENDNASGSSSANMLKPIKNIEKNEKIKYAEQMSSTLKPTDTPNLPTIEILDTSPGSRRFSTAEVHPYRLHYCRCSPWSQWYKPTYGDNGSEGVKAGSSAESINVPKSSSWWNPLGRRRSVSWSNDMSNIVDPELNNAKMKNSKSMVGLSESSSKIGFTNLLWCRHVAQQSDSELSQEVIQSTTIFICGREIKKWYITLWSVLAIIFFAVFLIILFLTFY